LYVAARARLLIESSIAVRLNHELAAPEWISRVSLAADVVGDAVSVQAPHRYGAPWHEMFRAQTAQPFGPVVALIVHGLGSKGLRHTRIGDASAGPPLHSGCDGTWTLYSCCRQTTTLRSTSHGRGIDATGVPSQNRAVF
jgi:hypothetical protein